jgi:murein DD-endopeptidase MepM/ murein hydrolase activator NlpD
MGIGWPIGNENLTERRSNNNISSPFGPRGSDYHLGFDINQNNGFPLLAVSAGTVLTVTTVLNEEKTAPAQGYHITIRSNLRDPVTQEFLLFTYMHMLERPTLAAGDPVSRGDMVGRVGSTGNSTGPHLHFEVSNSGSLWGPGDNGWNRVTRRVNPVFFYPQGSFTGNTTIWDERRP